MKTEQDFPKAVRNPYMGKFIQNGKFIVEIKHDNYVEVVEYDMKTQNKTVLETFPTAQTQAALEACTSSTSFTISSSLPDLSTM